MDLKSWYEWTGASVILNVSVWIQELRDFALFKVQDFSFTNLYFRLLYQWNEVSSVLPSLNTSNIYSSDILFIQIIAG